jgi:ATP-dependent DNA ligase
MSQDARRVDPSVVAGAKPAPFPGFVEPLIRLCARRLPSGPRWVHEIKFDGYRTQAHLRGGRPTIYTRAGYDGTLRLHPIDAIERDAFWVSCCGVDLSRPGTEQFLRKYQTEPSVCACSGRNSLTDRR